MANRIDAPISVNSILGLDRSPPLPIGTASQEKLKEIETIIGKEVIIAKVVGIPEIQGRAWLPVAEAKARDFFVANKMPVLIEETSFDIHDFQEVDGPYPGAEVKDILATLAQRTMHAREAIRLAAERGHTARATARTVFGAWDGQKFIYREGLVRGDIVMPRGDFQFGFDDIFVPDGQEDLPGWTPETGKRTFAEMTLKEKNLLSARTKALQKLAQDPIKIGKNIYQMVEPDELETEFARPEELQNTQAIAHAFNLDAVLGNPPNRDFEASNYVPFHAFTHPGGVTRVVARQDSNDNGLVTSGLDTTLNERHEPVRLEAEIDGQPIYYQMGPRQRRRVLLARADEYMRYHVDKKLPTDLEPTAYSIVRKMMNGEVRTVPKANKPSDAINELLRILQEQDPIMNSNGEADAEAELNQGLQTLAIATFGELGYQRLLSRGITSRKTNADYGLFIDPQNDGNPGSIFRISYMPQGSFRDLIVTSALSFTDCGISRNGYLANPDKQLALFIDVKNTLEAMNLPDDIYRLCLSKVGIAVGVEDPVQVEKDVERFVAAGCSKIRLYTTCNDERSVTVPEKLRQKFGNRIKLYYLPIVNYAHAKKLIGSNIKIDELGVGHGGGENCDSLGAGGAYTGLKLLYELYLDPDFNDVAVGLEGGGSGAIALMGMVDFISKAKQAFGGVVECGGVYVLDKDARVVQPYHGSASVFTQLLEASFYPQTAQRRTSRAGFVRNVEGVGNYARAKRSEPSVVNKLQRLRMYAGLMLADHGVADVNALRELIRLNGYNNIVTVSNLAALTAAPHTYFR